MPQNGEFGGGTYSPLKYEWRKNGSSSIQFWMGNLFMSYTAFFSQGGLGWLKSKY